MFSFAAVDTPSVLGVPGAPHASKPLFGDFGNAAATPSGGGFSFGAVSPSDSVHAQTSAIAKPTGAGFGFGTASPNESSVTPLFGGPGSTTAQPPGTGFGFGTTLRSETAPTPLFGVSHRDDKPSQFGGVFSGGFRFEGNSGSLFGPPAPAAPQKPSLFWQPTAAPAPPPPVPGRLFGTSEKSNPLGRGLSTRECFAVNDDRRFTKPAFQPTKPSPWAVITSHVKPTASNVRPAPVFGGNTTVSSGGGFSFGSAAPSPSLYAPTTGSELGHMTMQMQSISAMPAHADQSVEELRLSSRAVQPVPSAGTAKGGFTFEQNAVDLPSTNLFGQLTSLGLPAKTVDSENPFARHQVASNTSPFGPSDASSGSSASSFGPSTTGAALQPNPFSSSQPGFSPWVFGRPTVSTSTGQFGLGITSSTPQSSLPIATPESLVAPSEPGAPGEAVADEDQEIKEKAPALRCADANEPASLALPRLTPSYSTISGSRATAFVRRATVGRAKSFVPQRFVVTATPSPRKCTNDNSASPKKTIERTVVGRRDEEVWKSSKFALKTSLLATAAREAAAAFTIATHDAAEKPSADVDANDNEEHERVPSSEAEQSVDLDNYDL